MRTSFFAVLWPLLLTAPILAQEKKTPAASLRCLDKAAKDQDDMAVWVHPDDPALSTIIASDKKANRIFVYDLNGKTLQALPARHPGNIDLRYGFSLGGKKIDVVAFNLRDELKIAVCKVDPASRKLERIDDDGIATAENYGGTLYQSVKSGKLYFVTTSKKSGVAQYELSDNGSGKIAGKKVRAWKLAKCEGATADDEQARLLIGAEREGVWSVGAEPGDPTPGKLVIKLGDNGLTGDVEGLALYHLPDRKGYLIVSNQRSSNFKVYERSPPHAYVGTFRIKGAKQTDGLDVCSVRLGKAFPQGLFVCHTAAEKKCAVLATPWEVIARSMTPELQIDTSRKMRAGGTGGKP